MLFLRKVFGLRLALNVYAGEIEDWLLFTGKLMPAPTVSPPNVPLNPASIESELVMELSKV